MKERPILFSGPMVRGILEGRKTQTRRVIKHPRSTGAFVLLETQEGDGSWWPHISCDGESFLDCDGNETPMHCPYGVPGDRLWVRETFYAWRCKVWPVNGPMYEEPESVVYRADGGTLLNGAKWTPGIHMFRRQSRITLEITDVRVQRVQEISEVDAIAEGLHVQIGDTKAGHTWDGPGYHDHISKDRHGNRTYHVSMGDGICICHAGQRLHLSGARCAYRILWDSINAKRGFGWDANPWCWALTFKRLAQ